MYPWMNSQQAAGVPKGPVLALLIKEATVASFRTDSLGCLKSLLLGRLGGVATLGVATTRLLAGCKT